MKPELKRNITKKKVLTKVLKEMGNCNMDKFDDNSHIGQKNMLTALFQHQKTSLSTEDTY